MLSASTGERLPANHANQADDGDGDDAMSTASDFDDSIWLEPFNPRFSHVIKPLAIPAFEDVQSPETDELSALAQRLMSGRDPRSSSSAAVVWGTIYTMGLATRNFKHKFLRRYLYAYCIRVLRFYDDLIQSGNVSPSIPGTIDSFLVHGLNTSLVAFMTNLQNALNDDQEPIQRKRSALEVIAAANQDAKVEISNSREALGLVSRSFRLAFPLALDSNRHPYHQPALQSLFRDRMDSLQEVDDRDPQTYPDTHLHLSLYAFFRLIRLEEVEEELAVAPSGAAADIEPGPDHSTADADAMDEDQQSMNDEPGSPLEEHLADTASYLQLILDEIQLRHLNFETLADLGAWWSGALDWTWHICEQAVHHDLLTRSNAHRLLAFLVLQTTKLGCFEHAAAMAELLVIHYRFKHQQDPTSTQRAAELGAALGILALLLDKVHDFWRRHQPMHAVEEAEALLLAATSDEAGSGTDTTFDLLRAELKFLHARVALVSEPDSCDLAPQLLARSHKALRSSLAGLALVRSACARGSPTAILFGTLARILALSAEQGLDFTTRVDGAERLNRLRHGSSPVRERTVYAQRRKAADSLGTASDFEKMAMEAADIYRKLADIQPGLYNPLLAHALKLRAEILDSDPPRAFSERKQAIAIYERLHAEFDSFREELRQLFSAVSSHLLSQHLVEAAVPALASSIAYQHPWRATRKYFWRGYIATPSLRSARAMALLNLERYDEAVAEAEQVGEDITQNRSHCSAYDAVEAKAIRGFSLWMLGRLDEAYVEMGRSMDLVTSRAAKEQKLSKSKSRRSQTYVAEEDPNAILLRGWLGGLKAAMGELETGKRWGEAALWQARWMLEALHRAAAGDASRIISANQSQLHLAARVLRRNSVALWPIGRVLPHLLVIHAATLAQLGREQEAEKCVDEALEQCDADSTMCDLSTHKTALMLKRRLLGLDVLPEDDSDATAAATATGPVFHGFLAQLACSRPPPGAHS
ncbi:hypothetical protein OC834_000935 [Tilletia horrida]|nr:hypothetical protein OC834_000935 [Tilletia horrida]